MFCYVIFLVLINFFCEMFNKPSSGPVTTVVLSKIAGKCHFDSPFSRLQVGYTV